ncbi:MAG TPA: hypothetical protein VG100_11505 [Xanthobacteraceae bacterium]|nr:hypothetical protein [Xanthobacteraceae bacterium]
MPLASTSAAARTRGGVPDLSPAWALSLASRAVILDRGRVKMTGVAALLDDPEVRRAYLGV